MVTPNVLPSYAGIQTFMRSPTVGLADLQADHVAVFGVPFDVATRYGSRFGPRAIREQSIHYQYYIDSDAEAEIFDVDTGRTLRKSSRHKIVDLGDVSVFPLNPEKTSASIRSTVEAVIAAGAFPVMLGGDHTITSPAVRGLHDAVRRKSPKAKIGYIHLDAHFDLGDDNAIFGKINNATTARRVMELQGIDPRNISMIGLRGIARKSHVKIALESGINYYPMPVIHERGLETVVREAAEKASDGCDAVYLTLDIDVIDAVYAPGNGGIAFGGLTNMQGLQVVDILSEYKKIRAFDIAEVNPNYDVSDITAKFAATAVLKFLIPKLFDSV